MDNEIHFPLIVTLIKPIFEQENAPLDDAEIRRNLDALVALGYLTTKDDTYFLTFRAILYSQMSPSLAQVVKEEFEQYVRGHWGKAAGIVFLLVVLVSIAASMITVSMLK
jgi:hypothetical protein